MNDNQEFAGDVPDAYGVCNDMEQLKNQIVALSNACYPLLTDVHTQIQNLIWQTSDLSNEAFRVAGQSNLDVPSELSDLLPKSNKNESVRFLQNKVIEISDAIDDLLADHGGLPEDVTWLYFNKIGEGTEVILAQDLTLRIEQFASSCYEEGTRITFHKRTMTSVEFSTSEGYHEVPVQKFPHERILIMKPQ